MDIKDIKKAKERCEIGIMALIEAFEAHTECSIDRVNVIKMQRFGEQPKASSVVVDVKVP